MHLLFVQVNMWSAGAWLIESLLPTPTLKHKNFAIDRHQIIFLGDILPKEKGKRDTQMFGLGKGFKWKAEFLKKVFIQEQWNVLVLILSKYIVHANTGCDGFFFSPNFSSASNGIDESCWQQPQPYLLEPWKTKRAWKKQKVTPSEAFPNLKR